MTLSAAPVLEVADLTVAYNTRLTTLTSLRHVSLTVMPGEVVGVVGESGCGKSTLASTITGLLPPQGEVTSGSVVYDGVDLVRLPAPARRRFRGADIAMIFQDPLTSLNPTLRIGTQMTDALRAHHGSGWTNRELRSAVIEALDRVGIPDTEHRFNSYPYELSGGMRQRVLIATCVLLRPKLLVADEPTSALDVTLGAQILALLSELREEYGTAILLVSHDLGVIAETADRVVVLYSGEVVEVGDAQAVFKTPRHPYTAALLGAFPTLDHIATELTAIPGTVPELNSLPGGCAFSPRCIHAEPVCGDIHPRMTLVDDHLGRCHMLDPESGHTAARPDSRDLA